MHICKYCYKKFNNFSRLGGHVHFCKENPEREENIKKRKRCGFTAPSIFSKTHKTNLSKSLKGRIFSDSHKKKLSISMTRYKFLKRKEESKNWTKKKKYYRDCYFTFSLKDYADKFDFRLIEKYGMYNSTKNKNGISRDHIYSIHDGFKNNISAKKISHPANCRLVRHSINRKKNSKSVIELKELNNRIFNWPVTQN